MATESTKLTSQTDLARALNVHFERGLLHIQTIVLFNRQRLPNFLEGLSNSLNLKLIRTYYM